MYTEKEMTSRISSLRRRLRSAGGFDILLAHAPIRGFGDQEDLCHRGFECFGPLLDQWRPAVMVHGHVHQSYTGPRFLRERNWNGVLVINASTSYEFDLPETPDRKEPTRRALRRMEKDSQL
jgi:Icc-related predicted phosphoesterase